MKNGCPDVEGVNRERKAYQKEYHRTYVKKKKRRKKERPGASVIRLFTEGKA